MFKEMKIHGEDFRMIPVRTPLGDVAYISKTAFDIEKDEKNGWNCWSLMDSEPQTLNINSHINSNIKTTINGGKKMAKKGVRIVSEHIMTVLEPQKGKALDFTQVVAALAEQGWKHTHSIINDNLGILVGQNKIVKVKECFGIPVVQEKNGKNVITVQEGKKTKTVEV